MHPAALAEWLNMIDENIPEFAPRSYVMKYGGRPVFVSEFGWTGATTTGFLEAALPYLRFRALTGQRVEVSALGAAAQTVRTLYLGNAGYLDGIRQFTRARKLVIDEYPENGIEFGGFPELEVVYTAWHRKFSKGLFECRNLRRLSVEEAFPEEDCRQFSNLSELRKLAFNGGLVKSPVGLESCVKLEHLEFVRSKHLIDLGDLGCFAQLATLSLDRLPNLHWHTALPGLKSLRRLRLKEIPGLCQKLDLAGLTKLENISVINCRNASIDLAALGDIPNLRSLWLNVPHTNLQLDALFAKPTLRNVAFLEQDELAQGDDRLKRMAWARGRRIRTIQRSGVGKTRQVQIVFEESMPA